MLLLLYVSKLYADFLHIHSFPTRRSSDLANRINLDVVIPARFEIRLEAPRNIVNARVGVRTLQQIHYLPAEDRKSTRLNSSHITTSYAVFCLKKKNPSDRAHHKSSKALAQ